MSKGNGKAEGLYRLVTGDMLLCRDESDGSMSWLGPLPITLAGHHLSCLDSLDVKVPLGLE